MTTKETSQNFEPTPSRRSMKGNEFFFNFGGFLKRFKLTSENDKDEEILTLANLDSGYIRKFIIKKVDESSLFGRRNSSKSLKAESKNNSRNSSLRRKEKREKKERKEAKKRRLSTGSIQSACSYKSTKSAVSIKSFKSEAGGLKKKKKHTFGRGKFKIGWGSDDSDSAEDSDEIEFSSELSAMTAKDLEEKDDPGFINPAYVKESLEDEGIGSLDKEDDNERVGKEDKDDKEDLTRDRSDGDGSSDAGSLSSLESASPVGSPKFNLRMSPRPKKREGKRESPPSPISFRSGYQSNRSSVSSVRKGILKKSTSSTTINMEMNSLSRPHTPTDDGEEDDEDIPRFVRSKTLTKSYNRVKFILDSGRPDNITGDYNDIKIEKVDKSLSGDRSSKQDENTQSGLSKSGRKCLIFSAGVLVLTMAVILGSFFGSRKPSNAKAELLAARNIKYISHAVEGSFKIINENWNDKMRNVESKEFKKMSKGLEEVLITAIFLNATEKNPNSTATVKVIKYETGIKSVFRIKWSPNINLPIPEIKKRALRHLNKYGAFGDYKVDKDTFIVEALKDTCPHLECSNNCTFSGVTLQFKCICPDALVLANDRNCVPPKAPGKTHTVQISDVINEVLKHDNASKFVGLSQETIDKSRNVTAVEKPPEDGIKTRDEENEIINDTNVKGTSTELKGRVDMEVSGNFSSNASQVLSVVNSTLPSTEVSKDENLTAEVPSESPAVNMTIISNITVENATVTPSVDAKKIKDENSTGKVPVDEIGTVESTSDVDLKATKEAVSLTDVTVEANSSKESNVEKPGNVTVMVTTSSFLNETITLENSTVLDSLLGNKIEVNLTGEEPGITVELKEGLSNGSFLSNVTKSKLSPSSNDTQDSIVSEMVSSHLDLNNTTQPSTLAVHDVSSNESAAINLSLNVTTESQTELISEMKDNFITPVKPLLNDTEDHKKEELSSVEPVTLEPDLYLNIDTNINEVPQTEMEDKATLATDSTTSDRTSSGIQTIKGGHDEPSKIEVVTETVVAYILNKNEKMNDTSVAMNDTSVIMNDTSTVLNVTSIELHLDINNNTLASINATQNHEEVKKKEVVTIKGIPLLAVSPTVSTPSSLSVANSSTPPLIAVLFPPISSHEPNETNIASQDNFHIDFGLIANVSHDLSIPFRHGNVSSNTSVLTVTHASNTTSMNVSSDNATETEKSLVVCPEDKFECGKDGSPVGSCIPIESQCDSVFDCYDQSDEKDCIENKCMENYQCRWSGDCLARKFVCDGVKQCTGGDDEELCETRKCTSDEFKCKIGNTTTCLLLSKKCDGHSDCSNHTDEMNCTTECPKEQFFCPEGKCIPSQWKCDGQPDCQGGEDEHDCSCEGLDQSPCAVGGCVPTFKLCDGLRQCPDGSDEWGCIKVENETKLLQVRSSEGRWSAVCGDKWTAEWTDLVCEQLGLGISLSTEVKRVTESVPRPTVKLSPDASEISRRGRAPLQYFLSNSACSSDPLVHISCKAPQCGNWTYGSSKVASLHNDQKLDDDLWPSLGLLIQPETYANKSMTYNFACAATIITPSWVLTSYSCLESKANGFLAEKWALLIGEKSPKAGLGKAQLRYAKQVVAYPGAKKIKGLWSSDAALLRLRTPVILDDATQPICLSDKPAESHDQCVIATWKSLKRKTEEGLEEGRSQSVQSLPIPNLTLNTCNTSYYEGHLRDGHACASFLQDKNSKCTGNEGSPLMCKKKDGTWFLQGLLSHKGNCASFNLPSVFTDASSIQSWVLNTIGRPRKAVVKVKLTTTSPKPTMSSPLVVDGTNDTISNPVSPEPSIQEDEELRNKTEEEKMIRDISEGKS